MRLRRSRTTLGVLATFAALNAFTAFAVFGALGACSTSSTPSPFGATPDGGGDVVAPTFEGDAWGFPSEDATRAPLDAALPLSCPGVALPEEASTGCLIDTSESCPSCASWGFACPTWATPQVQDAASAGSFCLANATDAGGALVCCTRPMCIVSAASGGCDASAATRYECSGGAVPAGTCSWTGPSSPDDYCCE